MLAADTLKNGVVCAFVGTWLLAAAVGLGEIHYVNVTAASGIAFTSVQSFPGAGGAVGDYDNDGDLDVFLQSTVQSGSRLYRNNGNGTFTNVTAQVNLTGFRSGRTALFADLNNDGWADLILGNDDNLSFPDQAGFHILRNISGLAFQDVTGSLSFPFTSQQFGGITVGDPDRDGDLDIYFTHWDDVAAFRGSHLLRNNGGFSFTEITTTAGSSALRGAPEPGGAYWTPVFADFNNDMRPDLYVAVDFSSDRMFRNQAPVGSFSLIDSTFSSGVTHLGSDMGVGVGDFDNDGDLDIFNANICPQMVVGGGNVLYVNNGSGVFSNQAGSRGVFSSGWGWGSAMFDADLDGDLDIYNVNHGPQWYLPDPNPQNPNIPIETAVMFRNNGNGFFTNISAISGANHHGTDTGMIPFDYDNDGDLDILITGWQNQVALLENVTAGGNYLIVKPIGVNSAREAVGTRVHITIDGQTQMREVVAGTSFLSGPPINAHFGVGDAQVIDELRIRFLSGIERVSTSVAANRTVFVTEVPGDGDFDGDIDLADFAELQPCLDGSGPGGNVSLECASFDFDLDGDVDFADFARFQLDFTGAAP